MINKDKMLKKYKMHKKIDVSTKHCDDARVRISFAAIARTCVSENVIA